MVRSPLALAAVAVLAFTLAGCGQGGSSQVGEPTKGNPAAAQLRDTAPNWYDGQMKCPVCGGQPLKKEHYADVQGGRVYMDKEECVQEFKQDKEKYMQKLREQVQQQRRGG